MSETRHVKVDNWGVFFLQRLKSFFNKTDYCDLTLQFRDYAQLKVHRLVLNACTKYFELLERTCEMYENCLIMPDDLQADVVLPIVNFMYTGQLEYDYALYDRLYATAQIMNMTVLTKLLDAQKSAAAPPPKKEPIVMNDRLLSKKVAPVSTSSRYRETYSRANRACEPAAAARPTRYELPEGLDNDDLLEHSFADISYESSSFVRPVTKRPRSPDRSAYDEGSSSRKFEELKQTLSKKMPKISLEIPESRHFDFDESNDYSYASQQQKSDTYSEDDSFGPMGDYQKPYRKDVADSAFKSKYSVSAKESKAGKSSTASLNHAKIISEVLKKYPHLIKSNKNIKLKIMTDKEKNSHENYVFEPNKKTLTSVASSSPKSQPDESYKPDWVYVPRSSNVEGMAHLVSLGAENSTGPWLCLICGTPSKALRFLTYNKFYKHLTEFHKEKVTPKICEHCGFKSGKRNHLLHHMYTKHDIPPPPNYHFPKCNRCPYVALTEAFLIKHKLTHVDMRDFTCSVCNSSFKTRPQLLGHIQLSGHKVCPDRRISTKCVYCSKVFLREANLYTHLKVSHKLQAKLDGIIENSDDEDEEKYDPSGDVYDFQQERHVQIQEEQNGKIQILNSQPRTPYKSKQQQKILNTDLTHQRSEYPKGYSNNNKQVAKNSSSNDEHLVSVAKSISSSIDLVDVVVFNEGDYSFENETYEEQTDSGKVESELDAVPSEQKPHQNVPIANSSNQLVEMVSDDRLHKQSVEDLKEATVPETNESMVLNEDYPIDNTITNDTNIVYVYNEDGTDTQYIQTDDQQYENISREIDSSELQSQSDEKDDSQTTNNSITQEAIESWQVDAAAIVESTSEPPLESVDKESIVDELASEEQDAMDTTIETDVIEMPEDNTEAVKNETEEAFVENETVGHLQDADCDDEQQMEIDETPQNIQMEVVSENNEMETLIEGSEVAESLVDNPEADSMQDESSQNEFEGVVDDINTEAVENTCDTALAIDHETSKENKPSDDVAKEWFHEEEIQSEVPDPGEPEETPVEPEEVESAEVVSCEEVESSDAPPSQVQSEDKSADDIKDPEELEESIENIQEELEKQSHSKEDEAPVENSVDETAAECHESVENNNEQSKDGAKVSSLLNDWEDNDSQLDDGESNKRSNVSGSCKDATTIDKLVSDWDEEEEK